MEFVSLTLYRQATVPHLLIVVSIIVAGAVALSCPGHRLSKNLYN